MDAISLDANWIGLHGPAGILIVARVAGLCATAPLTAISGVDVRFKLLLAVMLGVVLIPVLEPTIGPTPTGPALAWAAILEAVFGALLGLSAGLIVAGARQAGDLVAAQAGLSAATLFNPETGEESSALGHLYGLIALGVFLGMQGPLVLVAAVAESYRVVPAGGFLLDAASASQVFAQVGGALALSLRAAAPAAIALAIAGLAMGWIGRLAPAIPVLAMSLPLRSLLGIVLVILSLGALVATLSQAWAGWPWGGGGS
ncbi:flagellar biosynthetic protein FliR [Aquisphaera insulae]|uniref:flagellar biosynthetic protein FliR n=1 Tax=Aquisphaera insulae TaxID=2712864 RepID=UPI0013E9B78A|nr:flagellar biosynthetic protein FliR [Aquisphaera insulae]